MTPEDVFKKINDLFLSYWDNASITWDELEEESVKIIREFGKEKYTKGLRLE